MVRAVGRRKGTRSPTLLPPTRINARGGITVPRLYFSSANAAAPDPGRHATWEQSSEGALRQAKTAPDGTGVSPNPVGMTLLQDTCGWRGKYVFTEAGSFEGTILAQSREKARSGVGVGPQGHQSQMIVRVFTAAGVLKGTSLAAHEPGGPDSKAWSNEGDGGPSPPMRNAIFPADEIVPTAAGAAMTPVDVVAGDFVIFELGGRYVGPESASGTNMEFTSAGASDLPAFDQLDTAAKRGWIEVRP